VWLICKEKRKNPLIHDDKNNNNNNLEDGMDLYECLVCGYIYDPEAGDPAGGIPPGVEFSALPEDWVCPECGAGKDQFVIVQI
jgi:rubredoxin